METGAHPAALPWRVINSITSWGDIGAGSRSRGTHGTRRGASRYLIGIIVHSPLPITRRRAPSLVDGGSHPQRRPNPMHASESGKVDVLNGKELSRLDAY